MKLVKQEIGEKSTIKIEFFDKAKGVVIKRDPSSEDGVFRSKSKFKPEDNSFLNMGNANPEVMNEDD